MSKHLKTVLYKAVLLSMVLGLLGFTIALAASGDLDTTFDGDGLVTNYASASNPGREDRVSDIAIQADGKIVEVGFSRVLTSGGLKSTFAVTRHNADGSPDMTFSGDSRLLTKFGKQDTANAVAVQANGKIIVAGTACLGPTIIGVCDVAIARYNPNGTLDTTFSADGKQTTDFGEDYSESFGLAIQSDGKIIVVGSMSTVSTTTGFGHTDFAVIRYNPNGTLDTTFSGDGKVNVDIRNGREDKALDLLIQSDGKIVVAGSSGVWGIDPISGGYVVSNNFAIARLNPDGTLDNTFSGDGRTHTNFGGDDSGRSLAIQPDGKLVLVGEKYDLSTAYSYFAMARYNTDGSLDTTFNSTGRKAFSFRPSLYSGASDVVVSPDGKILVIGYMSQEFALVRLDGGGSFDTTFSGDGKITVDFGGWDVGSAIILQPADGKYLLGGDTCDDTQCDFVLARVLP